MTKGIDRLRLRRDLAKGRLGRATIPHDPGALSGVAGSGYGKRKSAALRRESEAHREWKQARAVHRIAESRYNAAVRDQETSAAVNIGDIKPGDLIRTTSWYKVRRVNAKTITVEPSAPGMDALRYRHDQIKEHRRGT